MISFPNYKVEGGGGQINVPKKPSSFNNSIDVNVENSTGTEIRASYNNGEMLEDPYKISGDEAQLSQYYGTPFDLATRLDKKKGEDDNTIIEKFAKIKAVRSLFNPFNAVNINGNPDNTPLLNKDKNRITTDCSIKTLVKISSNGSGEMGRGIFKFADFMYCAELGKISNNHLLTLRRFAFPVGDNIFKFSKDKDDPSYVAPDVGRLVTWFDTEDNKLENILTYSYNATFKPIEAKREQVDTMGDADGRDNFLLKLTNNFSRSYSNLTDNGMSGGNDILSDLGADIFHLKKTGNVSTTTLTDYDNNKVYTPLNVMDSTHLYEGKLKFNQSIKLVFNYKLRAYNGINPKAAFLDLLGNILAVTYRRGKFWGGSRVYVGPVPNNSVFDVAQSFVDNNTSRIQNMFGNFNGIDSIAGLLGGLFSSIMSDLGKTYTQISTDNGGDGNIKNDAAKIGNRFIGQLGSMVKNTLGRPLVYALQSLLSGADVGFWHLTIGNPRNPIASIGNLILKNATVTHSGALGVDDFPSEIKVEVTLKPGRPRDSAAIERMYTRGESTIYFNYADSLLPNNMYSEEDGKFSLGKTIDNFTGTSANGQRKSMTDAFGDEDVQVLQRIIEEMA